MSIADEHQGAWLAFQSHFHLSPPFLPDAVKDAHSDLRVRVEEAFGTAVIEFLSLFFRHENTPEYAGVFSRCEDNGTMSGTNPSLATWVEEHPEEADTLVGQIRKITLQKHT